MLVLDQKGLTVTKAGLQRRQINIAHGQHSGAEKKGRQRLPAFERRFNGTVMTPAVPNT
jgi:hypothetical protein